MRYERNSRKILKRLRAEGWTLENVSGSHHKFAHPDRSGIVSVPHPKRDLTIGTAASIYRQAGWEPER